MLFAAWVEPIANRVNQKIIAMYHALKRLGGLDSAEGWRDCRQG